MDSNKKIIEDVGFASLFPTREHGSEQGMSRLLKPGHQNLTALSRAQEMQGVLRLVRSAQTRTAAPKPPRSNSQGQHRPCGQAQEAALPVGQTTPASGRDSGGDRFWSLDLRVSPTESAFLFPLDPYLDWGRGGEEVR